MAERAILFVGKSPPTSGRLTVVNYDRFLALGGVLQWFI